MESGRTDSADDGCIEEFSPIKVPFIHECAREYLTNHSVLTIIDKGMSVELSEGEEEMKERKRAMRTRFPSLYRNC